MADMRVRPSFEAFNNLNLLFFLKSIYIYVEIDLKGFELLGSRFHVFSHKFMILKISLSSDIT